VTWILVLAINFGVDNPIIFHVGFEDEASCLAVAEEPKELLEEIMGDSDWEVTTRCHPIYTGESYSI